MSEHLFDNGEKVLILGKICTVKKWGYSTQLGFFTYTIEEHPNTFYLEGELEKINNDTNDNYDTITLKRVYSTNCQVCGDEFNPWVGYNPIRVVYFIPMDNNICCYRCARESGHPYEPRIYKEGE